MNPITEYTLDDLNLEAHKIENCWLEISKDEKPVIKIKKDEREFYLGSKYSVERDIHNFMSIIEDINVNTIFIVFGLGSGQHILRLMDEISSTNKVVVIEPNINTIATVMKLEYADKIFNSNNVVVTPVDNDKIVACLAKTVEDFNLNNIKVMNYANYDQIYADENVLFYKTLHFFMETEAIIVNTELKFADQFFKCFMRNLKHISASTPINELKGIYNDIPAVIVSAGPSLQKNIELLKKVKGEFIIVAGGRTVKALQKIEVEPDFVAVIDPSEECYKLVENSLECTAPLIFSEFTNYDVVDNLPGKKIFYQEGFSLHEVTPKLLGRKVDTLYQGGSVAHTSASFARYIGCNPIIFIGQDFAYTNNKIHSDITNFEISNDFDSMGIMVDDIYGKPVQTDTVMNSYRIRMEMFIKATPEIAYVNCTEGGANMEGTQVMDFIDAIDKYSTGVSHGNKEREILEISSGIDRNTVNNNFRKLVADMESIRRECVKSVKYSDDIIVHYSQNKDEDISKLLNKINKLNKKIQKISFMDTLLKPTTLKIMMHPEYIEKLNETQKEKGMRLASQTKNLYEDIIKAIDEAMPIIDECTS